MVKPTLVQVLGAGATQDATTITIQKAALPRLNASANNSAESLLVGIVLLAEIYLTQANFDANVDQSVYLNNGFPGFTNRGVNNEQYRVDQKTINFAKLDTASLTDPDDY